MNSLLPIFLIGSLSMALMSISIIFFAYRYQKKISRKTLQLKDVEATLIRTELKATQNYLVGQNHEKDRIAKYIHDNLGSQLAMIRYEIQSTRSNDLSEIDKRLGVVLSDIRQISFELNKGVFIGDSFTTALTDYLGRINEMNGIEVDFNFFGIEKNKYEQVGRHIFRITQELIGNTLKHANAQTIRLDINYFPDEYLSYVYIDDGIGFDLESADKGQGLANLAERVSEMKGTIKLTSKPGQGIEVNIHINIENSDTNSDS